MASRCYCRAMPHGLNRITTLMTFDFSPGSFLLHQMSLEMDLDFFVMFSSMASIFGNMGQSAYSACNAFQDSLAQYRREVLGLPGLAINWGAISGAGLMERESGVAKLMIIAGVGFIHAKDGTVFLDLSLDILAQAVKGVKRSLR